MIWKFISDLLINWHQKWKSISKTQWVDISYKFLDALPDMDKIYDQKLLQQHPDNLQNSITLLTGNALITALMKAVSCDQVTLKS